MLYDDMIDLSTQYQKILAIKTLGDVSKLLVLTGQTSNFKNIEFTIILNS